MVADSWIPHCSHSENAGHWEDIHIKCPDGDEWTADTRLLHSRFRSARVVGGSEMPFIADRSGVLEHLRHTQWIHSWFPSSFVPEFYERRVIIVPLELLWPWSAHRNSCGIVSQFSVVAQWHLWLIRFRLLMSPYTDSWSKKKRLPRLDDSSTGSPTKLQTKP